MNSGSVPSSMFGAGLAFLVTWSIGVHIATLNALPFGSLYVVLATACTAALVAARFAKRLMAVFSSETTVIPLVEPHRRLISSLGRRNVAIASSLGVLFVVAAAIQYFTSNFQALWVVCLVASVFALSRTYDNQAPIEFRQPAENQLGVPLEAGTLIVVGLMLAFYFFTSLPDADDSLFLNMAVGAKRERGALLATDTMLGLPQLDFIKSTYRLESYQLLAAVISDLLDVPVIYAAHALVPALACLFSASVLVLIHYAIFRGTWFVTLLLHLAWIAALDGTLQSYGYHGITRFFQGKGPFVTTMVPLIAFLTFVAVRNRSWLALLLLSGAMIASVGLTANAVYVGPLCAAMTAAPMFFLGDASRRAVSLRLFLAIIYPALLVTILLLCDPPAPSQHEMAGAIGRVFWVIMGSNYAHAGALVLLFSTALAALFHMGLRSISLYTLILLVAVLNPFLWDIYGRLVTGNINYRLLWAVPLPLILAILSGVVWSSGSRVTRVGLFAFVLGTLVAPGSILHKVDWGFSSLKVPEPEFAIAKKVNAKAAKDELILAPEPVSAWIPTLDDARPVVEARALYFPQRRSDTSNFTLRNRNVLFAWVSQEDGVSLDRAEILKRLVAVDVRLVATIEDSRAHRTMEAMGTSFGYENLGRVDGLILYRRVL